MLGHADSVRGLEQSELGGFLWEVYQNDSRHDALDGVLL